MKNKRYKMIQEAKRIWLNLTLHGYELTLKAYEAQYQVEFVKLEAKLLNNTTSTTININGLSLFDHIKEYLNYQTNKLMKYIHVQMSSYRRVTLQNRQRSSSTKTTIGVSPDPNSISFAVHLIHVHGIIFP